MKYLKPSATLAVVAKQQELKQKGIDIISLAAGEPDFDTPGHIKEAAREALRLGKTKYTEVRGIFELRQAIVDKFWRENNLKYSTDQIIVTNGGKQALFNLFFALLDPGDEVIIPAPYWISYPEQIKMCEGVPVFVETVEANGYQLDINAIKSKINLKTKAIIINSPNNPTGAVYPKELIKQIVDLAKENDIWVVSDEIYEHICYETEFVSAATFGIENVITINGASKAYAMTGWRLGYAAGPTNLLKAMADIQSQTTSNASSITQWAALAALNGPQDFVTMARNEFQKRRDVLVTGLNNLGFPCTKPKGAFYVLADTGRIDRDDLVASQILLEQARIAAVPGADFAAFGKIRLSYATSLENLENALERLKIV